MKKLKLGRRLIAFILVLITVMSLIPLNVFALAKGDIVTSANKGQTGIDESTLNQNGTINWPVKIYDYLADGMLFEFAQYGGTDLYTTSDLNTNGGGQYVYGEPMPYARYATDYTTDQAYKDYAYTTEYGRSGSIGKRYLRNEVAAVNNQSPRYLRINMRSGVFNDTSNYGRNFPVSCFHNDNVSGGIACSSVRYMVLVYRSNGIGGSSTSFEIGTQIQGGSYWRKAYEWGNSPNEWAYKIIDLRTVNSAIADTTKIGSVYITVNVNNTNWYLDLSHVAYFSNKDVAYTYAQNAIKFNKNPGEYLSGIGWNSANNTAFGMLYATNGGDHEGYRYGGNPTTTTLGGQHAGYYTHQIGYTLPDYYENANLYNAARKTGKDASTGRFNGTGSEIGSSDQIYWVSSSYKDHANYQAAHQGATSFDLSELKFDGYTLLTTATQGAWTAGLLEGSLNKYGLPEYRQEAVEYIADLLSKTLTIPKRGTNGNLNYSYIEGPRSAQFGKTNGVNNDLAQGLRNCLGIVFSSGASRGSTPKMGTYAETRSNSDNLRGAFLEVANGGHIKTCMDAAYYLLNNLFEANSYNQLQDDYRYFTLSSAKLDNGQDAYVFDGGFSTGASLQDLIDGKITQAQYKADTRPAVEYSAFQDNGDGTIKLGPVQEKDLYYYSANEWARTTRFPFLPVTHSEGDYAGPSKAYYFAEDGKRNFETELGTYYGRNYNYALASNGEFVYTEEDNLFFEFEGDDDVYLFINGQLVLDLGGGHAISNSAFKVNDYVYWARNVLANPGNYTAEEIKRANALNLENGEIASFDFYYMERHGYGANMRVVTNMRITDPAVRVEKTAYQAGKQIEYGGIVDPADPIEYNFKLTNSGNTKLYNLSFSDDNIGVYLNPEQGIYVKGDGDGDSNNDINGYIVTDARGGTLDATDITAVVQGYQNVGKGGNYIKSGREYIKVEEGTGTHIYYDGLKINFVDNEALKKFMKTLESSSTDNTLVDEEQTQNGSGLWVDANVIFKGIYYTMTHEQEEAGVFNNTVRVTATTKVDVAANGNQTLRSEASHRVYVTAIPSYYQWAGHELFITEQRLLNDASAESDNESSMLHDYKGFFDRVGGDTSIISTRFTDRNGNRIEDSQVKYVDFFTTGEGWGFKTYYDKPGIYEFFITMNLDSAGGSYPDISKLNKDEYAIIRVLIIVASAEDSSFVLDYGLKTENLDVNGELFKNDDLLGSMSGVDAKLMGINAEGGSYLSPTAESTDHNRIDFEPVNLDGNYTLDAQGKDGKSDGFYSFNIDIPTNGRKVNYDKYSGMYSLVDAGTTTINARVPYSWDTLNLYYWYDDGSNNAWPGTPMKMTSHGNFALDIPGNVPHIILNNGTNQSIDINLNTGQEAWVNIDGSLNEAGLLKASVEYRSTDGVIHAKVPEGWGDVYLYCWDDFGNGVVEWPGTKIDLADEEGYFTYTIPGDITNVIINNGLEMGKQTEDLKVYAGKETWITVNSDYSGSYENDEGLVTYYYKATSSRSNQTVTMHARIPDDWEGAGFYYWNSNGSSTGIEWPGLTMTKGEDGWYTVEGVPADVTNVVINEGKKEGSKQTFDTIITPGTEAWLTVLDVETNASVTATVPDDWGNVYFYFFNDNGEPIGGSWPGRRVAQNSDGTYSMQVPPYASRFIVNNNSGKQTQDLGIKGDSDNKIVIDSSNYVVNNGSKMVISVPGNFGEVYIHHWDHISGFGTEWPGEKIETVDGNGNYIFELPSDHTKFIINNNSGWQTGDQWVFFIGDENRVNVDGGNAIVTTPNSVQSKHAIDAAYGLIGEEEGFTFTPTDFMDNSYDMYMALTVHENDMQPSALSADKINIGKEVQMYKKISVVPANVVYYEDDFAGIVYNENTANEITHYGQGSGSLTQSVNQNQEYGNEIKYQGSENDEMTGGSLTDVNLKAYDTVMTFEFTGTGFELVGHTHALESGSAMVNVTGENGFKKSIPVITEFDNGNNNGTDTITSVPLVRLSGLEFGKYTVSISGVPIFDFTNWDGTGLPPTSTSYLCIDGIRIYQPVDNSANVGDSTNLAAGKPYEAKDADRGYTANLTDGVFVDILNFEKKEEWFGFNKDLNSTGGVGYITVDLGEKYDLDKFRMHLSKDDSSASVGQPQFVEVLVSTDGKKYDLAGKLGVKATSDAAYWAELSLDETVSGRYVRFNVYNNASDLYWNILNEVEVYGTETVQAGKNDAYNDVENGAQFNEIRNLIADRHGFVVKYDDTAGLSVSGGTNTWTENRNNELVSDHTKWTNNVVNSVNDYLLTGPNNEVYLTESTEDDKSALVFYVSEDDSDVHNFQIAARGVDYGAFVGANATGLIHARYQYGAIVDGKVVWKDLATAVSTTEQYYTIPYEECPYDAANQRYQIAIRLADTDITGMASFTSVKTNGLEFWELNTTEVPDVVYDDELCSTLIDGNGNTLDTSDFVDFIKLVEQMTSTETDEGETVIPPEDKPVVGQNTATLASLYDTFSANSSNFALKDNSRFYIVSDTEPSDKVKRTAALASAQYNTEAGTISNWPEDELEVVWGSEEHIRKGDIVIYVDDTFFGGDKAYREGFQIDVSNDYIEVYVRTENGLLYALNTLQKHFRKANSNAIKGFTLTDAPDTDERTIHLDIARKYLTKNWICNYIAEMSWMGYNALELHLSEDGGFRSDIWDDTYYPKATGNTGNDFSWAIGSMLQPWCFSCPDPDSGKYLTAAELVEICETAKRYNVEIIPSFDTPAHVGWLTKHYYDLVKAGNSSIRNFKYNGTNYTLPTKLNYRNTGTYDFAILNLGDATVQKFALAMYTDIAAFFREYAGSTKLNICGDEVGLKNTDTWDYADFVDYVNSINSKLNSMGYRVRMYNDFLDRPKYVNAADRTVPALASNIEIVYWDAPNTSGLSTDVRKASYWYKNNRVMHSGVQNWTYYVLRIFNDPSYTSNSIWGMDARHPNNTWWSFSRNTQSRIYNEWNPTRFSESHDLAGTQSTDEYYSGANLASGYFMVWNDYAGLSTEKEMWNGVDDKTKYASTSESPYSLIKRMWSGSIKMWSWNINDTVPFADFEVLRDGMGYFPGYGGTYDSCSMVNSVVSGELPTVTGPFLPTYTVTFLNEDGSLIEKQEVVLGNDAKEPATPTKEPYGRYVYTFAGWDKAFTNITADTVVKATFTEEASVENTLDYLEVKVIGGTGFNMRVNNSDLMPMGNYRVYNNMKSGTNLTIEAFTTKENRFLGWINATTGEVVSSELIYSFYTTGNDIFLGIFETDLEDSSTVTFKNDKNNQIIDIQTYSAGEAVALPEDPAYMGYEFMGWNMTIEEIQAKIDSGEDVTVTPVWGEKATFVSITVNNGVLLKSSGVDTNGEYRAYRETAVEANAVPAGKKFAYWTEGEGDAAKIVSYEPTYVFYPCKDIVLTAVFVDEAESVDKSIIANVYIDTTSYTDKNNVVFTWSVPDVPEYTFVNAGLLLVNDNKYNDNTFVIGTNDVNVIQFVPGVKHQKTTGQHSITQTNVFAGDTMVAKAFVQYRDAEGVLRVMYSDEIRATK